MAGFDPDSYLAQKTTTQPKGFDPSAYLAEKSGGSAAAEIHQPNVVERIKAGREKSSYEGVADEQLNFLQKAERGAQKMGLIKPGYEAISPKSLENKKSALLTAVNTLAGGYLPQIAGAAKSGAVSGDEYLRNRDEMDAKLKSIPPGIALPGMAIGVLPTLASAPLIQPAKKLGTRILQQGALAGAAAFAANPGDKPGEYNPTQLAERASNVPLAAGLGAGLTAAAGLPEMADTMKRSARMRAVKQSGAMLGDFRALDNKPIQINGKAANGLDVAGEMLLTPIEGKGGRPVQVVTPGATLDDVAHRSHELMQEHGNKIKQVMATLDSHFGALASGPLASKLPNAHVIADDIQRQLMPQVDNAALDHFKPQIEGWLEGLRKRGNQPMTFAQAKAELNGFDKLVNWDKVGTPGKELAKQVRGIINNHIESAVDAIGQATPFPLFEQWKRSKNIFGMMTDINEIANDKLFRHEANRFISPSDYSTGLAGALIMAAHGGSLGMIGAGLSAGAANHVMRKYGNAVAATAGNSIARKLENPVTQAVGRSVTQKVQPITTAFTQAKSASDPVLRRLQK